MEPKKINSLRDLQMEKYRLKVSMEYTQKRLGDNWGSIKAFFTPEHLAFEAGKWLTAKIAGGNPEGGKSLLPTGSQEVAKTDDEGSSKNWLIMLMPFLVGALSALLQAYSGQENAGE